MRWSLSDWFLCEDDSELLKHLNSEVRKMAPNAKTQSLCALLLATPLNKSRNFRSNDDDFRSVHVGYAFSATAACSHQKKTKQIIKIKQQEIAAFLTRG